MHQQQPAAEAGHPHLPPPPQHPPTHTGCAGGRRFRAIVCESRPLCEGVSLANALAAAGVQVTVITDAQAGAFMEEADLVLVGADSLTADAVVNKVLLLVGWVGGGVVGASGLRVGFPLGVGWKCGWGAAGQARATGIGAG